MFKFKSSYYLVVSAVISGNALASRMLNLTMKHLATVLLGSNVK